MEGKKEEATGKYRRRRKENFAFWLGILALILITCHDHKYTALYFPSHRSNLSDPQIEHFYQMDPTRDKTAQYIYDVGESLNAADGISMWLAAKKRNNNTSHFPTPARSAILGQSPLEQSQVITRA